MVNRTQTRFKVTTISAANAVLAILCVVVTLLPASQASNGVLDSLLGTPSTAAPPASSAAPASPPENGVLGSLLGQNPPAATPAPTAQAPAPAPTQPVTLAGLIPAMQRILADPHGAGTNIRPS